MNYSQLQDLSIVSQMFSPYLFRLHVIDDRHKEAQKKILSFKLKIKP